MLISILRFNFTMRDEVWEEKGGKGEGKRGVTEGLRKGWMDGWMLEEGTRLERGMRRGGLKELTRVGRKTKMENKEV
jgi:hypothetical protein